MSPYMIISLSFYKGKNYINRYILPFINRYTCYNILEVIFLKKNIVRCNECSNFVQFYKINQHELIKVNRGQCKLKNYKEQMATNSCCEQFEKNQLKVNSLF